MDQPLPLNVMLLLNLDKTKCRLDFQPTSDTCILKLIKENVCSELFALRDAHVGNKLINLC